MHEGRMQANRVGNWLMFYFIYFVILFIYFGAHIVQKVWLFREFQTRILCEVFPMDGKRKYL